MFACSSVCLVCLYSDSVCMYLFFSVSLSVPVCLGRVFACSSFGLCLFICLNLCVCMCFCFFHSLCLCVRSGVCLSPVSFFVCLYVRIFVFLSLSLSVPVCLGGCLLVPVPVCLSVYLNLRVCIFFCLSHFLCPCVWAGVC